MTTIEVFGQITDILKGIAKELNDLSPKIGVDFTSSDSSPISPTSRKLSDREVTLQVQAFRKMQNTYLPKALKLAEELSIRPEDDKFTDEGIASLNEDIGAVNAAGMLITNEATNMLKNLKGDSPQADLIHLGYAQAVEVYARLQVFARKAKPKGKLLPVIRLKPLK